MPLDLALTDAGYNGRTARYGFSRGANGDVLLDSTQAYAVMGSIACVKKGWWADSTHGSELATLQTVTRFTPSPTPSQAEAMAVDALLPLEQANLITANPTAEARVRSVAGGLAALDLNVSWATPGGAVQSRKASF